MRVLTVILLLNIFAGSFCFGEEVLYPERIVSLGPTLTKQIYLLGAEDKLVGITTYCPYPAGSAGKERVGTLLQANLEKIVALKPDLVLATSLTDLQTKQKLKDLGIKVTEFALAQTFSQICAQFLELGKVINREDQAREIIRQTETQVDIIKQKTRGFQPPTVFVQVGAAPLFTVSEDSFFNDYIEFAGGTNVASDSKAGFYSQELVLQKDPEVIIITTMGMLGEKEKKAWQKFRTLRAVKNNRIFIVDEYKFCSPTPVEFVEALEQVVQILHPEYE